MKSQQLHFISKVKAHIFTIRYGIDHNPWAVELFKFLQENFIVWCSNMENPFSRSLDGDMQINCWKSIFKEKTTTTTTTSVALQKLLHPQCECWGQRTWVWFVRGLRSSSHSGLDAAVREKRASKVKQTGTDMVRSQLLATAEPRPLHSCREATLNSWEAV